MAELDKNKQADVSVFMFMRINGQSARPFLTEGAVPGMGSQKMSDLTYYNSAASEKMRKVVTAQMAHMMIVYINTYYTQVREKKYENKTVPELVNVFTVVMSNSEKSVSDLAKFTDEVFRYKNEGSAAVPVAVMVGA